ncbi:hypothetical protein DBV15_01854 [Temnothorax longispinosus]|uniref:Uncharacterized protein n=1 Tax=Temnothorax longispinosus TaxID=300112 RepID=A0A4S2KW31_9HYME|nr:hypothetical protein DBV15_01854 [Temnothorax longispinosus]
MRSLHAGNDGAFRHEANCNAPPAFPRICPVLQQWTRDAPPHGVSGINAETSCNVGWANKILQSARKSTPRTNMGKTEIPKLFDCQ